MRILILILVLAFQSAQAQNYTIIHVIGKIYDSSNNSYLKSGSKLSKETKLKFETPNARAAALSSSRGRYVIQQQRSQGSDSDLAYTLSAVLSPARGKMSTRAGGINNQMDFVKKFGEGSIAIVGGRYTTTVSSASYPSNDSKFFYASYLFNSESINKKLEVIDDQLIFDVNTFYAVDGIAIDPKQTSDTKLFYYDSSKEESQEITTLNFVVVSDSVLMSIKTSLNETNEKEQTTSIIEIINSLYGYCQSTQIQAAVNRLN